MTSVSKLYPLDGYPFTENKFILGWMDNYESITSMKLIFKTEVERTIKLSINNFFIEDIKTSNKKVPIFTMFNEIPAYAICFNYIVSFFCEFLTVEKNVMVEITGTPKVSVINNYAILPKISVPFNNQEKTMIINSGIINIVDNIDISNLSI